MNNGIELFQNKELKNIQSKKVLTYYNAALIAPFQRRFNL